ncbi:MAG TPA: hypothetical protein PKM21_03015 [Anaerolineales bacterium]|nr:hypothetical protein [Anaerolineales bacterium]
MATIKKRLEDLERRAPAEPQTGHTLEAWRKARAAGLCCDPETGAAVTFAELQAHHPEQARRLLEVEEALQMQTD